MSPRRRPADVIVLGSGLTAALAALELARVGQRTVVLAAAYGGDRLAGHVPSGPPFAYVDAVRRWGRAPAAEVWTLHRRALGALREEWGQGCDWRSAGGFTLAGSRPDGLALAESEDALRDDGFAGEFLDGYMLEARFAVRGFTAGFWAEGEAELDVEALTRAAHAAAVAAGATFLERAGAAEVSRTGIRVPARDGEVTADVAVLASATDAPADVLEGRIELRPGRGGEWAIGAGAALPSPVRVAGRAARWTTTGGRLRLDLVGESDPSAFAAAHLPELAGRHEAAGAVRHAVSRDGLPWSGPLPGRPVFLALGGTSDLACEPLLSRWAVSDLVTGRDATPAPLRAVRPASAML